MQKLLAAAGVGSRREVERWIREGRLEINGAVPALGTKLKQSDRVTLDGRPVRVRAAAQTESRVLILHRPPGTPLDVQAAATQAAEHLKVGRASRRWLVIQPLPPVDGGLEILTDDGAWADRVSRGAHLLTVDYILRMRGALDDALTAEFLAATSSENEAMSILAAEAKYGEGSNHWLSVTARATRSALIRHWWAARGMIVSRLMRVRFGPVQLGRDLPRGRLRLLTPGERSALMSELAGADESRPA
ncbi:MAG TPA: S4 domain-containing protein [Steroidobacteraceae bacterium]|nr:S4 domain-containing protein [Steroidobacteraceae bacterium]